MKKLIKITGISFIFFNGLVISAQEASQFGIATGLTFMHEKYSYSFFETYEKNTQIDELDSIFGFRQALDIKATLLLKDGPGATPSIMQFGVQYVIPKKDSITYTIASSWGNIKKKILVKSTPIQIELKIGYQLFSYVSEFSLFYMGWGFGAHKNKLTYYCENENEYLFIKNLVRSEKNDDGSNILKVNYWEGTALLFGGLFYEFEKFRMHCEFGFSYGLKLSSPFLDRQNLIHGKIGVFIPLIKY